MQSSTTYSTSGFAPGDVLTVAQQAGTAVTTTGRYPWSLTVNYGTSTTLSGVAYVVAEGSSSFGPGWTLSGVNQLVSISVPTRWAIRLRHVVQEARGRMPPFFHLYRIRLTCP